MGGVVEMSITPFFCPIRSHEVPIPPCGVIADKNYDTFLFELKGFRLTFIRSSPVRPVCKNGVYLPQRYGRWEMTGISIPVRFRPVDIIRVVNGACPYARPR